MTTVKEPPNGSKSPSFFRSVVSKLKPPVAPVSPGTQHHTPSPLKSQISDMQSPENVSRCEYTFSDGRRCRNQRAQLCGQHILKAKAGRRARSSALEVPPSKRSAPISPPPPTSTAPSRKRFSSWRKDASPARTPSPSATSRSSCCKPSPESAPNTSPPSAIASGKTN